MSKDRRSTSGTGPLVRFSRRNRPAAVDSFPSDPPVAVRDDLFRLRDTLDRPGIPRKAFDGNLLIATSNIRGFGRIAREVGLRPERVPRPASADARRRGRASPRAESA